MMYGQELMKINDKFNSTAVCVKEYIEIVGVSDYRFRDGQE